MFTFTCPQCHFETQLDDRFAGRKGRCPSCEQVVDVEKPTADGVITEFVDTDPGMEPGRAWEGNLVTLPVAVVLTMILYCALFFAAKGTYISSLFLERGITPPAMVLMAFWGAAILVAKYMGIHRELRTLRPDVDVLPLSIGIQITVTNADAFLVHLRALPGNIRKGRLVSRIYGALQHFKSRPNAQEVYDYLASQAAIDNDKANASFISIRTIVWGLPILGFIGTVLGIGAAVGGLSETLAGSGADASTIAKSLRMVTGGLATAFDTTLVALVFSIVLMFPLQGVKRKEELLLSRVEEFGNEEFIRRLGDRRPFGAQDISPEITRLAKTLSSTLAQIREEFRNAGKAAAEEINVGLKPAADKLAEEYARSVQSLEKRITEMLTHVEDSARQVSATTKSLVSDDELRVSALSDTYKDLMRTHSSHAKAGEELSNRLNDLAECYARLAESSYDATASNDDARMIRSTCEQVSASIDRLDSLFLRVERQGDGRMKHRGVLGWLRNR